MAYVILTLCCISLFFSHMMSDSKQILSLRTKIPVPIYYWRTHLFLQDIGVETLARELCAVHSENWARPFKIATTEEEEDHFVDPSKFFHQLPCPPCISGTSMQAKEALLNKLESAGVSDTYSTPIASIQASMQQPAFHIHAG